MTDARFTAKKQLHEQKRERFLKRYRACRVLCVFFLPSAKRELDFTTSPSYKPKPANSSSMIDSRKEMKEQEEDDVNREVASIVRAAKREKLSPEEEEAARYFVTLFFAYIHF